MKTKQTTPNNMISIQEQDEQCPFQKKLTEPEYQGYIFGKKQDLRKSLYLLRQRKQYKERQNSKDNKKQEVAEFANPFIRMKVESQKQKHNSKKLFLACIDIGIQHNNPESSLSTTKRSPKPSFTIKQKLKKLSQTKSNKKQKTQQKQYTNDLIKKSKEYLNTPVNQTQLLLEKFKAKKFLRDKSEITSSATYRKKIGAPKILNSLKLENDDSSSLWPFSPYKTIKDRVVRSYEMIISHESRNDKPLVLKI